MKIGEAYVELEARMKSLEQDLQKARSRVKADTGSMQKDMDRFGGSIKGVTTAATLLKGALAAMAGSYAVNKIREVINETAAHRDSIAKLSKATGLAVETLSAFEFATERSGTSLEAFTNGYRRLVTNVEDSQRGLKESIRNFEALGISVRNANGDYKDAEQLFYEVAEAVSQISDPVQKGAIAMKLFGRAGQQLIPFLNEGEEGIRGLVAEAERLGVMFGKEQAQSAEDYADALTNFNTALRGVKENLAGGFLDDLTLLLNGLTGTAPSDGLISRVQKKDLEDVNKQLKTLKERRDDIEEQYETTATRGALMLLDEEIAKLEARQAILQASVDMRKAEAAQQEKANEAADKAAKLEQQKQEAAEKARQAISDYINNAKELDLGTVSPFAIDPQAKESLDEMTARLNNELIPAINKTTQHSINLGITWEEKLTGSWAIAADRFEETTIHMSDSFTNFVYDINGLWADTIQRHMDGLMRARGAYKTFENFARDTFGNVLMAFNRMIAEMAAQELTNALVGSIAELGSYVASSASAPSGGGSGIGIQYKPGMSGVSQSTTFNIQAVDAKSFHDLVQRNPESIIQTVSDYRGYGGNA